MKDITKFIRTAFGGKLNGNVFYNGVVVPVVGRRAPANMPTPYICISEQRIKDDSSKSCFSNNNELIIEVVTFSANGGAGSEIDDITNDVLQIVNPMNQIDYPNIDADYNIYQVELISITPLEEWVGIGVYDRKLIRLKVNVDQK